MPADELGKNSIVLVTGAGGFIGRHLVAALLKRGCLVRALDLTSEPLGVFDKTPQVEKFLGDVRELKEDNPTFHGVSAVFHCAGLIDPGQAQQNPEQFIDVNAMGYLRVLQVARAQGVAKSVFVSSAAVYGNAEPPYRETYAPNPVNPYGFSKLVAEQIGTHWSKLYGIASISARLFNVYGADAGVLGGIAAVMLDRVRRGESLTIHGDGMQRRDFIYISDCIDALICLAERGIGGEVYNVGMGETRTVRDLAELLNSPIEYIEGRAGDRSSNQADTAKIFRDTGWQAKVSLEDGIQRCLDAIKPANSSK